jgi:ubiquinone/menaquinone biosynthesis C-methylase UbiE
MSDQSNPLEQVLATKLPAEGGQIVLKDVSYVMSGGILRQKQLMADVQEDTASFYDVHWKEPGAYDNDASDKFQAELFHTMFPGYETKVPQQVKNGMVVLDVGCGSGVAGRAYFHEVFDRIKYVGVDMSAAIEQAKADFEKLNMRVGLLQAELNTLPFSDESVDFVFCPGVLHYAIDMKQAITSLARVLKKGGHFVSWIYKKQKPIRHLTDQHIRSVISKMSPQDAIAAVKPLTELGIALGEIKDKLVVPNDIPFLDIKKGTYTVQTFFYYHIMKLFYNPSLPFKRHVINNLNAYAPKHVLFHSEEEIRSFFIDLGFKLDTWTAQGNGIGIVAIKP